MPGLLSPSGLLAVLRLLPPPGLLPPSGLLSVPGLLSPWRLLSVPGLLPPAGLLLAVAALLTVPRLALLVGWLLRRVVVGWVPRARRPPAVRIATHLCDSTANCAISW